MTDAILKLLEEMVQRRASDLHLTAGVPPQFRIDGVLVPADQAPLNPEQSRELCHAMLDEKRIAWAAGDIIENRPALSRWHPDHAAAFEDHMKR